MSCYGLKQSACVHIVVLLFHYLILFWYRERLRSESAAIPIGRVLRSASVALTDLVQTAQTQIRARRNTYASLQDEEDDMEEGLRMTESTRTNYYDSVRLPPIRSPSRKLFPDISRHTIEEEVDAHTSTTNRLQDGASQAETPLASSSAPAAAAVEESPSDEEDNQHAN